MLCSIGEESAEDARRILTFLCFSARPLYVAEMIDAVAVDVDLECFDPELKVENADDLLRICPGLIEIYTYDDIGFSEEDYPRDVVRIAHFSVQEFLLSDRISRGPASRYTLSPAAGHLQISTACLIYLCNEDFLRPKFTPELRRQYPLASFAARHWYKHWDSAKADMRTASGTWSLKLFTCPDGFSRWIRLANPELAWENQTYDDQKGFFASPIYYAAILGLEQHLVHLLSTPGASINAEGGVYGYALIAASSRGNENVVHILLDAGADINARGYFGTALQTASLSGHREVVQILLDAGADFNARGEIALQEASLSGHQEIVQMLLDVGADVNAQGGIHGTALQAASAAGHKKIVQILLDAGADVNAGGWYNTALQRASQAGHKKIVQILLDAGADINAREPGGTALQLGLRRGRGDVVQLLLDAGADASDDELAAWMPWMNLAASA